MQLRDQSAELALMVREAESEVTYRKDMLAKGIGCTCQLEAAEKRLRLLNILLLEKNGEIAALGWTWAKYFKRGKDAERT